jgi:hypothetical protein
VSTTPYHVEDLVGAAAFTGTAAHTLCASPLDDIGDDCDPGDRFEFYVAASILNSTGSARQLHLDMLLDGTIAHRETIASIGTNASPRFLVARYTMVILDSTTAFVGCDITLSGTGFVGPNPRYAANPADPDPTIDTSLAIPVDFQVTLSANDSDDLVCTPKLILGDKVLNSPGGGGGVITSVNGQAGPDVTLTAADVDALGVEYAGLPVVRFDDVTGQYGPRPDVAVDYPALYVGVQNPTDILYVHPTLPFLDGVDLWWRTNPLA